MSASTITRSARSTALIRSATFAGVPATSRATGPNSRGTKTSSRPVRSAATMPAATLSGPMTRVPRALAKPVVDHVGADKPRKDDRCANAGTSGLGPDRAGESDDTVFGRGIGGAPAVAICPADDARLTMWPCRMWQEPLQCQPGTGEYARG